MAWNLHIGPLRPNHVGAVLETMRPTGDAFCGDNTQAIDDMKAQYEAAAAAALGVVEKVHGPRVIVHLSGHANGTQNVIQQYAPANWVHIYVEQTDAEFMPEGDKKTS